MVDDLVVVTECGSKAIEANSIINTFIENQKLTFSDKKCYQMHVGNPKLCCPLLNVHEKKISRTNETKYLGNILSSDASTKSNTKIRTSKAYGIVAEILSIVNEIPFGKFQLVVGLQLREFMLINGTLYNSEVC